MSLAELLPRRGIEIAQDEAPAAAEPDTSESAARPAVIGGAVGAAAGVAAAILTIFAWSHFNPPLDQRLDPLAQRVATLDGSVRDLATTLGPVQAELANFYDVTADLSARIDGSDANTAALLDELERALAQQADIMTVGSPVFAVAVSQLRAAALSGLPFEAELLNVYALSAGDPSVDAALSQLVGASRAGIVTLRDLRASLAAGASAAGIGIGERATVYDYGVSMLANYVGISNEAYLVELARSLIAQADAQLVAGDVVAARETMQGVDPTIAVHFADWFTAAQARIAEDAAIAAVTDIVKTSISGKLMHGGDAGG